VDNLEPVSSRKEEKEARRAERLAREREELEAAHRRRRYAIIVGGALGIAVVAGVVLAFAAGGGSGGTDSAGGLPSPKQQFAGGIDPPPQQVTELDQAAKDAGCILKNPVIEGRTHIPPDQKVTYKTNPPTSGNHDPVPADDGVYSRPMTALETRHFVHTLEHGRIELQYDPTLPKHQLDQLGGLFNEDPYHMVLLPNRKMPYQIAATAWGHLIGCEKVNDKTFDALRAFRDRYRDQGPEQVP
jgi:hypothetical protein